MLRATSPQTKPQNLVFSSGAVAAVFLLHPIQMLAVLHVVQRMTSLSAFFLLAALLAHVSGREHGGRAGAALLVGGWCLMWPLSILAKETGLLFPYFALAWELILRRGAVGKLDRFARGFAVLAGIATACVLMYLLSSRAQWLWSGFASRPFTLTERLLTEARVLWFYLGLIAAPRFEALGLYHDDIAISTGLLAPWTTLPSLLGLLALAWLVWWLHKRAPLVAFGIAWFLIGHSLESTFLPLELAHEHRNYLPLFGIALLAGRALLRALESKKDRKEIGLALCGVTMVYLVFVTAMRSNEFSEPGLRTQIEAQNHRSSAQSQYEAGRFMAGLPDATERKTLVFSLATGHYKLSCELDPNLKMCWLALMELNCHAGLPVEAEWTTELGRRLRETPFGPADRNVLYALKEAEVTEPHCVARSDVDSLFNAALANPSVSAGVQAILHSWHADYLWLAAHDMNAARGALSQSLQINPGSLSNRLKWAQLVHLSGESGQARKLLMELRDQSFSVSERKTLDDLLAGYNITAH